VVAENLTDDEDDLFEEEEVFEKVVEETPKKVNE